MRALFIAIALAAMCSCVKAPYFDLRQPIYLVTDKSFWLGCEDDKNVGEEACRQYRIDQIYAGFSQWFDYFDQDNRPRAVVVSSEKELPPHLVNAVIHLRLSETFCGKDFYGKDPAEACYYRPGIFSSQNIAVIFQNKDKIDRLASHEIGHVLGLDDNYAPAANGSVMTYPVQNPVTNFDVKSMCKKHRECKMVKRKRYKSNDLF